MPTTVPFIPSYITVHLGAPDAPAENVTVSFRDYVKNVASSEVYPTWAPAALRANILAITSFALNRIYTEFYRSRGYPFDITSSTAYDQQFVQNRNFFSSISVLVDELFDSYIRRVGNVEPLAAKFCNGTTVTCEGLSQWGSQYLAEQGYNEMQILRNYYGNNIELVVDAPQQQLRGSYPGTPFQQGSRGRSVLAIQRDLNRISQSFPAIPKLTPDGIYGPLTEAAVRAFQQAFGLTPDGIVGPATWYALERVYVGVLQLAELRSEGLRYEDISLEYPGGLSVGDRGDRVSQLQYFLSVIAEFVPEVPSLAIDGYYGRDTRDAVYAFQRFAGLPITGTVDDDTWNAIYDQYASIDEGPLQSAGFFPEEKPIAPTTPANARPRLHALGIRFGNVQQELRAFQRENGLRSGGALTRETAEAITRHTESLRCTQPVCRTQFPGRTLSVGSRDAQRARKMGSNSCVGVPVTSLQTMLRRLAAQDDRIPAPLPDGIYGAGTMRAVSAFQRCRGLPPTGLTDYDTWQAVVAAYDTAEQTLSPAAPLQMTLPDDPPLGKGSSHPSVRLIQTLLHTLAQQFDALPDCPLHGSFDAETEAAVRALQACCGLEQTGRVDKATWQGLTALYIQATEAGTSCPCAVAPEAVKMCEAEPSATHAGDSPVPESRLAQPHADLC